MNPGTSHMAPGGYRYRLGRWRPVLLDCVAELPSGLSVAQEIRALFCRLSGGSLWDRVAECEATRRAVLAAAQREHYALNHASRCDRKRQRVQYVEANRDRIRETDTAYRRANREKTNAKNRKSYIKNKDKQLAQKKEYYKRNKEKRLAYLAANKEKINEQKRKRRELQRRQGLPVQ